MSASIYDNYDNRLRDDWKAKKKGEVLRDGEVLRVPMRFSDAAKADREAIADRAKAVRADLDAKLLANGAGHLDADRPYIGNRPGTRGGSDDDRARRQRLYADADAKLSNAWKGEQQENGE